METGTEAAQFLFWNTLRGFSLQCTVKKNIGIALAAIP
jgi:hypothetical protein